MSKKLDDEELAALAGFTVSFFNSNSELKKIWNQAKKEQWDPVRILAAMRQTKWFKGHSESQRQMQLLKKSDPAEYKRRFQDVRSRVQAISRQTGLGITSTSERTRKQWDAVAQLALANGWNDQQIKTRLAAYATTLDRIKSGRFHTTGLLKQGEDLVRQLSRDYGVKVSHAKLADMAKLFAAGSSTSEKIRQQFVSLAKSAYAGIASELDSGLTVRQVAEPYIESMARLLEMNGNDINTDDDMIRRALTSRSADNKPVAQPLWQFEEALRKDRRWLGTNNAQQSMMSAGYRVLRDMGMIF